MSLMLAISHPDMGCLLISYKGKKSSRQHVGLVTDSHHGGREVLEVKGGLGLYTANE
jgi:hypothetical protein